MFQIHFGELYRKALAISIMGLNWCFTYRTNKFNKRTGLAVLIEDTLSPIFVTICTYPMRWFGIAHGFFKRIHDSSIPWGYKLIALFLTFPCFYASDFFFKCAYFLNHRRLSRIGRECAALGGQNGVWSSTTFPWTSETDLSSRKLFAMSPASLRPEIVLCMSDISIINLL